MRIWSYEALPSWKIIVWVTQLFSHATAIIFGLRVLVTTKRQYYLLSLRYDQIFKASSSYCCAATVSNLIAYLL
ncbi:hypothetical protein [Nostoc sp. ChiSLP03a]|uniref:hypothetical protein n=1 Tax=Nostoc sp. ChiSLP03a TaxID=3075380 RepID=UPI002AD8D578|nr:hypothetical protein [Nostoc sp. ChiSLP03a]